MIGEIDIYQQGCFLPKLIILLLCIIFSQNVPAIGSIQLNIKQLLYDYKIDTISDYTTNVLIKTLKLENIALELDLSSNPMRLHINFAKLKLPKPYTKLSSIKLTCDEFSFQSLTAQPPSLICSQGVITTDGLFPGDLNKNNEKNINHPSMGQFSLSYNPNNQNFNIEIKDFSLSKHSEVSLQFKLENEQWKLDISAEHLNYNSIKHYIDYYYPDLKRLLKDESAQISFKANINGKVQSDNSFNVESAVISGDINNISYTFQEEMQDNFAENLGFHFDARLNRNKQSNTHVVNLKINKPKGSIYQNEIYVEFNGNETLKTRLTYNNKNQLNMSRIDLLLPDTLVFQSKGNIGLVPNFNLNHLAMSIDVIDFGLFNKLYLSNILEGTDYEGLNINGKSNILVNVISKNKRKVIDIKAKLDSITFELNDKIQFNNIHGSYYWNNERKNDRVNKGLNNRPDNLLTSESLSASLLSWESAVLNELPLGKTTIEFLSYADNIKLTQSSIIPIFDGELQIDHFEIKNFAQQDNEVNKQKMSIVFDGLINPISLTEISHYFDWPILDGSLSAIIPTSSYSDEQFTIGGAMMLQVFDGFIIIKDLKIENPLEDFARLEANIDLNNLSLQALTNTYDFGEIQGRLEGKLANLVLDSWKPKTFDAYLQTPENDNSRHRISQRAIDNLSSLGGASGLLSRSFLSFFETFSYNKIGLKCLLKNNVCNMSGVEAKGKGYYIVKGGGIPRIDVMGFQDKVNWDVLMSRLKSIQSANQAVIE